MATTSSIGSSIDVNTMVSQLMAVERQSVTRLQQKQAGFQAKLSAYGTLLSAVTNLKGSVSDLTDSDILGKTASVSDSSVLTATADSSARTGSYSITVNRLASSQSIYSTTFSSEDAEVADLTTFGTQKMRLRIGNGSWTEITVNSENNSLTGIMDAINDADAGVTASILNSGFIVTETNNTIVFNDGSNRTATLTAGTYSGDALAAEIKRALEAANGGDDTYTVTYDQTTGQFSIMNDTSNTNTIDILWEDAATTAESLLGFTAVDHSPIATGGTAIGDVGVGGYRLVISSDTTGVTGRITIETDEDNDGTYAEASDERDATGLSRLAFNATYDSDGKVTGGITQMTQSVEAIDASMVINGLTVTRSSNSISDVISGVTFNLLDDSNGSQITLQVADDTGSLSTKINSFVSSYNTTMNGIKSLKGNASQTGALRGDSTLTSLSTTLRSITTTQYRDTATDSTLTYLGISHDKNGVLGLDSAKLADAIADDPSSVIEMINTMASALEDDLETYINDIIPARKEGYQESIDTVKEDIEDVERSLSLKEIALRNKYIALDKLLSQLNGTSNYISQQTELFKKTYGG